MTFLVSITVLIAFLVSTYGWGRIVVPLFYREAPRSWPYIVALGLCVLVVIGGGLNLLHIARPSALEVLSGLGLGSALIFTLLAIWRDPARFGPRGLTHRLRQWPWRGISLGDAVPWLVIAGATAFFIAYLLPAAAFNFHDDFHKYFVAPMRMLQTGSLGGGPFEVIGFDHLGTQSFLQAFILTRFEPVFLNGFDYIFCFLLAGLVLNDLGRKLELHWFYRTIAVLCLVLINPQYVNISALYSSVLLILATAYAALLFAEVVEAGEFRTLAGAAVPVGLFLACLISLKSTFIGFTLILGAMLAVGFLWDRAHRRQIITAYGAALIAAAVVLVPWSVISENNLVGTIDRVLGRMGGTSMGGGGGDLTDWGRLGDLFLSRQDLFYGGWLPGYNVAILSVLAAALVSGALLWHNREQNIRRYLVVLICFTLAAVLAYLLNVYLFAVKVGRIDITIRYFTPILIATLPLAVLALGQVFWRFRPLPPGAMAPNSVGAVALLALFVLVAGLFAQPFIDRAAQMAKHRNDLSFRLGKNKFYQRYNQLALSQDARKLLRGIQSKASANAPILAWIAAPFQLDFGRNPVFTVESPRLVVGTSEQPFDGDAEAFRLFLKKAGIRYVLWQLSGYGMRSERSLRRRLRSPIKKRHAKPNLDLRELLGHLERGSTVLLKNESYVLLDIGV